MDRWMDRILTHAKVNIPVNIFTSVKLYVCKLVYIVQGFHTFIIFI